MQRFRKVVIPCLGANLAWDTHPLPHPHPNSQWGDCQLWPGKVNLLEIRILRPPMSCSWDVCADLQHVFNPVCGNFSALLLSRIPSAALGEGWNLAPRVTVTWSQTYSLVVSPLSSGLQQNCVSYKANPFPWLRHLYLSPNSRLWCLLWGALLWAFKTYMVQPRCDSVPSLSWQQRKYSMCLFSDFCNM